MRRNSRTGIPSVQTRRTLEYHCRMRAGMKGCVSSSTESGSRCARTPYVALDHFLMCNKFARHAMHRVKVKTMLYWFSQSSFKLAEDLQNSTFHIRANAMSLSLIIHQTPTSCCQFPQPLDMPSNKGTRDGCSIACILWQIVSHVK